MTLIIISVAGKKELIFSNEGIEGRWGEDISYLQLTPPPYYYYIPAPPPVVVPIMATIDCGYVLPLPIMGVPLPVPITFSVATPISLS